MVLATFYAPIVNVILQIFLDDKKKVHLKFGNVDPTQAYYDPSWIIYISIVFHEMSEQFFLIFYIF